MLAGAIQRRTRIVGTITGADVTVFTRAAVILYGAFGTTGFLYANFVVFAVVNDMAIPNGQTCVVGGTELSEKAILTASTGSRGQTRPLGATKIAVLAASGKVIGITRNANTVTAVAIHSRSCTGAEGIRLVASHGLANAVVAHLTGLQAQTV